MAKKTPFDLDGDRTKKTPAQKAKDLKSVIEAEKACCVIVTEFSQAMWDYEWAVEHIGVGTYRKLMSAASLLHCAESHVKEEYVCSDFSKLSKEERDNTTYISYYG